MILLVNTKTKPNKTNFQKLEIFEANYVGTVSFPKQILQDKLLKRCYKSIVLEILI
jgi:hypothetical protein